MKRLLLLGVALLMTTSVARADHITIYRDAISESCVLDAGFNSTAVVVHKFATGATGSRFKVAFPAGTGFFGFNTTYAYIGTLTSDLSLSYGQCLTGSIVLGSMFALLAPGTLSVLQADGIPYIISTNCIFTEFWATGGQAYVGVSGDCGELAVESSTWGKVKSLYR